MKKSKRRNYYFIGVGLVLLAIGIALLHFFAPAYTESVVAFLVGGIMCGVAISIIAVTCNCKERVAAVLIDYGFEQFKAHITSSPIFTYRYQGKIYTTKSAECLSQRYVLKHYKKGKSYTIYISSKDPSIIKLTRRVRMHELLLFMLGLAIMILSIVSIIYII